MKKSCKNTFEEKEKQWNLFMEKGVVSKEVRPFIGESWKRSKEYGVKQEYKTEILEEGKLLKLLAENRELLSIAKPIIVNLMELVVGSQYMITIHDPNGYMIDYVNGIDGNNEYEKADTSSFQLGAKWSEACVGTNGAYVSMILNEPVQIIGPEHYCKSQHGVTCSAAPIHDNQGHIIGCINMSGNSKDSNLHTLGLVASGAYAIENQLALFRSYKMINDAFHAISDGMVILDKNFHIQRVSKHATNILKMQEQYLLDVDFKEFLPDDDIVSRVFCEKSRFEYNEYNLKIKNRIESCHISIIPMVIDNHVIGIIILLKESKAINKMVNTVAGNIARYTFDDIITKDEYTLSLIKSMKNIASTQCCVLIEGESGTGKELFAHSIHSYSNRCKGPFVAINCASLPASLVESELFGYESGSFTGARNEGSPGKFELANGGTIFLDEIGELPLEFQAKLLRVLDTHRITRIGGKVEKELDVRVITATNRDLRKEVEAKFFREDLYFRINVLQFFIPPLRDRKNDISLVANYFLTNLNNKGELCYKEFSREFIRDINAYRWPGNVRELQNIIVRSYYISSGSVITPEHLPPNMVQHGVEEDKLPPSLQILPDFEEAKTVEDFEKQKIISTIASFGGDAVQAGISLGMSKATIYRRIKKYNIDIDSFRK